MSSTKEAKLHVLNGGSASIPERGIIYPQYRLFAHNRRVYCETTYHGQTEQTFLDPPERNDWELTR